ncbi:MAG: histidinol-phosphate transaminase [bacterium]|nr:histidinol-phosphate transaminase [bacterium]
MPIFLNTQERVVALKLAEIKKKSGSHSPSPSMLEGVKGVRVTHDFCYLSNPHAAELFLRHFKKDFKIEQKLRNVIEYYPSQNRALAKKLERAAGVSADNIFVGNGATEIIQAVLHNFVKRKILVPVPTFSPYLEFSPKGVRSVKHQLLKKNQFRLDLNELLAQVRKEKPDAVVIISPNNPEGGQVSFSELRELIGSLKSVGVVIVDESFIHFSSRKIQSVSRLVGKYPNLVVIKSLSKDFGIAGLRLGYAVMSQVRVTELLARGYLWNVSGFGEYFLDLLNRKDFLREYEKVRLLAIKERDGFFTALSKIPEIRVYPSKANSFLVELLDGSKAEDLTVRLLVRYGIYIRSCGDKVGLNGEFVRIASRNRKENSLVARALYSIFQAA